ncbi:Hypothetical predicted protein [Mytilus galloprovincialis]|uniref:Uncharacterized protein n=1 Tax=Mytilus galloprovincialis TaxID=29158 RepID=A0A8B6BFJ3_MYTGA|nr:Hypothetical predicted protein [Mytilus galloprovincialis]
MSSQNGSRFVFMEKSRNGKKKYSHRFGNLKNVVLQQSAMGTFFVNIYDNRLNFNDRLSLAFEEAVQFSELISQLERLKDNFKEENKTISNPTEASGSTTFNPEPFVPPTYKPELYIPSSRGSAEMPPTPPYTAHKKKEK